MSARRGMEFKEKLYDNVNGKSYIGRRNYSILVIKQIKKHDDNCYGDDGD